MTPLYTNIKNEAGSKHVPSASIQQKMKKRRII